MKKNILLTAAVMFCVLLGYLGHAAAVSTMTKEDLKKKLGSTDVVIIDVRAGKHWKSNEHKIKGAVREDPKDVPSWIGKYTRDKIYVLYCA